MKINYLKINGFGKLADKEIKMTDNINLIYGENEAGKTTLLKFISGMFYGISRNKNKKEFSDYERYKPWNKEEFSGKMIYSVGNGEEFEIFRDFNKKNPQIYNKNGEDISKTFTINKTKGNEFFYEQTKIDEDIFFTTTMITQKQVILDNNEQQLLTQKMANILSTGQERTSYKKTMDKLNKKLVEEIGTDRTTGRPINLIDAKIEEINRNKDNMEIDILKKEELEIEKKEIEEEIFVGNKKIELIKDIKKYKEKNIIEEEKIKINKNIIEEENKKIKDLKDKIRENPKHKKEKNYLFFIILFLIICNIILILFNKINIFKFTLVGLIIIDLIVFTIGHIKNKRKQNSQKDYKNKISNEIELIKNNIENISNKIKSIEDEINKKDISQNLLVKNKYKKYIEESEINSLLSKGIEKLNYQLEELEKSISTLNLKLHTNQIDYNNLLKKIDEKAKLEEKLQNYLEEKQELMSLNNAINLAKEALENAYNKMKNEITPKFTENLSSIVGNISNGKYKNVKFIDGEGIVVELENGEYVNANRLSIGTIDQLYLSLRLSAIEEITEEKMPIILDEVFAYYDTERLTNILKYLNEKYKENQIIIFTCSNREKEVLEKNNINYTYINLHN